MPRDRDAAQARTHTGAPEDQGPARAVHACRRRPAARECLRRVPGRAAGALCGKARSDHRRYCNDRRNAGRVQPHAAAGGRVDALEINILSLQTEKEYQCGSFEQRHIDIVSSIKKQISIPVIVKLGSNLTNPIALINQLYANGANAVVLFNRFYQPDINIDTMTYSAGDVFSTPADLSNGLRWTAIASAQVPQTDYAISGGVHDGKAIVKAILAGASAVELCSVIYQRGNQAIADMTNEMTQWMNRQGYKDISEFKSSMNALSTGASNPFERTQFMKYFSSKE